MKKQDVFFYSILGVISIAIIVLVLFKFVFVHKDSSFAIDGLEKLTIKDLHGSELNMVEYLKRYNRVFVLLFGLGDCNSCVYKGVEDLKMLNDAGKHSIALIVSNDIEDVKAWTLHYEFLTVFILKRLDFFDHITCVTTPVMITFEKGKIKGYRYIMPN